jgi:hypothetical protein
MFLKNFFGITIQEEYTLSQVCTPKMNNRSEGLQTRILSPKHDNRNTNASKGIVGEI